MWLGRPGDLKAIIPPKRGLTASPERIGGDHQLLGGSRVVDTIGYKRTYHLAWKPLTHDQYGVLEALYQGGYGVGPFALIDPNRRNLLTANQSSGSDALRDTEDITAEVGAVVSSLTNPAAGTRSLAWTPGGVSGKSLLCGPDLITTATIGNATPALQGYPYTLQVSLMVAGTSPLVQLAINWYTAAGVLISASLSTGAAPGTTHAVRSFTATAPAGTAYARAGIYVGANLAGVVIYTDQWQLEQSSVANPWVIGTGVPIVAFSDLTDSYDWYPMHNPTAVLVEL